HADAGILVEALAQVVQRLVHLEGHRVARLGAVERDGHDAAVLLDEDGIVVGHGPDHSAPAPPPATLDACSIGSPTCCRGRDASGASTSARRRPTCSCRAHSCCAGWAPQFRDSISTAARSKRASPLAACCGCARRPTTIAAGWPSTCR